MGLWRPEKGQWPILWEQWKKMVSFEMSLQKGKCISWTWWYKTFQVEGNNTSRGRWHDLESYVYDLFELVEIQCLRVMVRSKRWNRCCKQILISGPYIVNYAQKSSNVQNTPRKPSRTECRMTMRICEYFTEDSTLNLILCKKTNRRSSYNSVSTLRLKCPLAQARTHFS